MKNKYFFWHSVGSSQPYIGWVLHLFVRSPNIQTGFRSSEVIKLTGATPLPLKLFLQKYDEWRLAAVSHLITLSHQEITKIQSGYVYIHTFAWIDWRFVPETKALIYTHRSTTEAKSIQSMNQRLTKVFNRRPCSCFNNRCWRVQTPQKSSEKRSQEVLNRDETWDLNSQHAARL